MWPFVTGFFYVTSFHGSSTLYGVSIPCFLYLVLTFYLCPHQLMDTGCFYLLSIMRNTLVQVFVWDVPRSGITQLYGNSVFSILGNDPLFSKAASPFDIPISNARGL